MYIYFVYFFDKQIKCNLFKNFTLPLQNYIDAIRFYIQGNLLF